MSDPSGRPAPGEINSLLIWRQSHPFYFVEAEYDRKPSIQTLGKVGRKSSPLMRISWCPMLSITNLRTPCSWARPCTRRPRTLIPTQQSTRRSGSRTGDSGSTSLYSGSGDRAGRSHGARKQIASDLHPNAGGERHLCHLYRRPRHVERP